MIILLLAYFGAWSLGKEIALWRNRRDHDRAIKGIQNIISVAKSRKRVIYRSSITGQIVSKRFAEHNPTTTEREELK